MAKCARISRIHGQRVVAGWLPRVLSFLRYCSSSCEKEAIVKASDYHDDDDDDGSSSSTESVYKWRWSFAEWWFTATACRTIIFAIPRLTFYDSSGATTLLTNYSMSEQSRTGGYLASNQQPSLVRVLWSVPLLPTKLCNAMVKSLWSGATTKTRRRHTVSQLTITWSDAQSWILEILSIQHLISFPVVFNHGVRGGEEMPIAEDHHPISKLISYTWKYYWTIETFN